MAKLIIRYNLIVVNDKTWPEIMEKSGQYCDLNPGFLKDSGIDFYLTREDAVACLKLVPNFLREGDIVEINQQLFYIHIIDNIPTLIRMPEMSSHLYHQHVLPWEAFQLIKEYNVSDIITLLRYFPSNVKGIMLPDKGNILHAFYLGRREDHSEKEKIFYGHPMLGHFKPDNLLFKTDRGRKI